MKLRLPATVRHHVAALMAVVALLGQALFPHVHVWHGPQAPHARETVLARCVAECPTALTAATTSHEEGDADQHGASCPLCRAQSDARSSLLPSSLVLPLPAAAVSNLGVDAAASIATAARSLAAPRAPPVS